MKKVIIITGPTAIGKTKISIEVAKYFNFEIINGDSVAVYKRLDIGSAKPTPEEQGGIKHYLIDIKDVNEGYSVYDFQHDARKIINESNDIKIICGGTGLYLSSVIYNYEFKAKKRDEDEALKYENYSNMELYNLLLEKDPNIDKEKIHPNNRKRVLRAIEVIDDTNKSIQSYNKKNEKLYDYYIVYLNMDRNILYERINKRVDLMFEEGLLDEVKMLYDEKVYPHAIGYSELKDYFDSKITLDEAKEEIKKNTRHLAKRQLTWFNHQLDTHFYNVDLDNIESTINNIIADLKEWLK